MSTTPDEHAVLYARFSPRPQEQVEEVEKTETIEKQFECCRQWCQQRGLVIRQLPGGPAEFCDRQASGVSLKRPGLWAAIAALEKGDRLVVYRLQRLCRGVYESHMIQRAIKGKGAWIASTLGEGTWADTPEDRLLRNIFGTIDQYQRECTSIRTKMALLRYQAEGRRVSCRTPYGTMRDPNDDKRLVPCQEEVANIQVIRQMIDARAGDWLVCKYLTKQGYKPRGERWHRHLIRNLRRRYKEEMTGAIPTSLNRSDFGNGQNKSLTQIGKYT